MFLLLSVSTFSSSMLVISSVQQPKVQRSSAQGCRALARRILVAPCSYKNHVAPGIIEKKKNLAGLDSSSCSLKKNTFGKLVYNMMTFRLSKNQLKR